MAPTNSRFQRSMSMPTSAFNPQIITRSLSVSESLAIGYANSNPDLTGLSDTLRNLQATLYQTACDLAKPSSIQINLEDAWSIMPTQLRILVGTSVLSVSEIRLILDILSKNLTVVQFSQWTNDQQIQLEVENNLTKCINTIQQLYKGMVQQIQQQQLQQQPLFDTQHCADEVQIQYLQDVIASCLIISHFIGSVAVGI